MDGPGRHPVSVHARNTPPDPSRSSQSHGGSTRAGHSNTAASGRAGVPRCWILLCGPARVPVTHYALLLHKPAGSTKLLMLAPQHTSR
eukprot:4392824-Prymnesium_polylepis.1